MRGSGRAGLSPSFCQTPRAGLNRAPPGGRHARRSSRRPLGMTSCGSQATTLPRRTMRVGPLRIARSSSGSASYTTKSASLPSSRRARQAEPLPRPPGGGAQGVGRREPVRRELEHLVGEQAVRQHPAGVGAGVDRHARLVGRGDRRATVASTGSSCARRTAGTSRRPRRRTSGSCRAARPSARARCRAGDHRVDEVGREAGAVLDAVDAGLDQVGQRRRSPKTCAVTRAPLLVGRGDRRVERVARPRRASGRRRPARSSHRRA